jgi:hypothetical protein
MCAGEISSISTKSSLAGVPFTRLLLFIYLRLCFRFFPVAPFRDALRVDKSLWAPEGRHPAQLLSFRRHICDAACYVLAPQATSHQNVD